MEGKRVLEGIFVKNVKSIRKSARNPRKVAGELSIWLSKGGERTHKPNNFNCCEGFNYSAEIHQI